MKADKAVISVLSKYTDIKNIFSKNLKVKLLEYTKINDHATDLIKRQQLFYKPLYSLRPVKLETLKINIKISLSNSFIKSFKSLSRTFMLFFKNQIEAFNYVLITKSSII